MRFVVKLNATPKKYRTIVRNPVWYRYPTKNQTYRRSHYGSIQLYHEIPFI